MHTTPQFLTIGHITRDLRADGSFTLGGTVTFAALTAARLGTSAGIVTRVDNELQPQLSSLLPGILLHAQPSPATTTFVNRYQHGFRTQYLYAQGAPLLKSDIPGDWRSAPVVLLGPVAQELTPDILELFPRRPRALIAATPQGWLRRWDADGRVWPTPWNDAARVLPLLDVLVLSHDDLLPFAAGERAAADEMLARWSTQVPLLVATDGRHGATLFRQGQAQSFPAYPSSEVDPTGAGDVFAAAFLIHLHRSGDPERATDFANCVASFAVEHEGTQGIPTYKQVAQRMRG